MGTKKNKLLEFFTYKDFQGVYGNFQIEALKQYAERANEKLAKEIESWPVVYGRVDNEKFWCLDRKDGAKYQARVAFIEALPKRECVKHEPQRIIEDVTCIHCGKELIAEWKVKE